MVLGIIQANLMVLWGSNIVSEIVPELDVFKTYALNPVVSKLLPSMYTIFQHVIKSL